MVAGDVLQPGEGEARRVKDRLHQDLGAEPLAELNEPGIHTYAFAGPLLPHFATQPELLDDLFGRLVDTGVSEVFTEHINLKRYIRERMDQVLASEPEQVRETYLQARTKEHREQLHAIVAELLDRHRLLPHSEEVIHHDDNEALQQRLSSSRDRSTLGRLVD